MSEPEVNSSVTPPGSSESFDDFKSRIMDTMTGIASSMEGNTVVLTHSKPIGVMNGWEHAGYPEDGSIHMPTYEEGRERKPGNHEEMQIPKAVQDASYAARIAPTEPKQEKPYGYSDMAKDALGMLLPPPTRTYDITPNDLGTGSNIKPPQAPQTPEDIQYSALRTGMFAGRGAIKNSPKLQSGFDKAIEMHSNNKSELEVFRETGWYQDKIDGRWKYFIPNKDSKIMTDNLETTTIDNPTGWTNILGHGEEIHSIPKMGMRLQDVMQHPALYEAYPWLKDVMTYPMEMYPDKDGSKARGVVSWDREGKPVMYIRQSDMGDLREVIHHETQHLIQGHEGFPMGTNIGDSKAWYKYATSSGETEARNSSLWSGTKNFNTKVTPNDTMDQLGVKVDDIYPSTIRNSLIGQEGRIAPKDMPAWRTRIANREEVGQASIERKPRGHWQSSGEGGKYITKSLEEGKKVSDLAKELNLKPTDMWKIIKDNNYEVTEKSRIRNMDVWTPEKIEQLKNFVGKGSFSDIAEELGEGFTKNHVASKMRQLGLSNPTGPRTIAQRSPKISKPVKIEQPAKPRTVMREDFGTPYNPKDYKFDLDEYLKMSGFKK